MEPETGEALETHEKLMERIERTRDELRVKAALGRAEIRDAWEEAETKWSRVQGELKLLRDDAKGPLAEVRTGIDHLLEDVRHTYERIRHRLGEE